MTVVIVLVENSIGSCKNLWDLLVCQELGETVTNRRIQPREEWYSTNEENIHACIQSYVVGVGSCLNKCPNAWGFSE